MTATSPGSALTTLHTRQRSAGLVAGITIESIKKPRFFDRGFQLLSAERALVVLQFYISTETLNPDLGITITGHIFQVATRTMFCMID